LFIVMKEIMLFKKKKKKIQKNWLNYKFKK
jgi:hypothetical protein